MFRKIVTPLLLVAFMAVGNAANAQADLARLKQLEDSMVVMSDSMYKAFIPDDRPEYTQKFVKLLVQALKVEDSWKYDFPKLKDVINILYPDDKSFRIFNWAIAPQENTRRYYGAMQMEGSDLKLYPLVDYSQELKKCGEDSVLTDGKWFGGLVYKIMAQKVDGEDVYTLFTQNGASPISNKKVLDPMVITEKGPVFGAPIFSVPSPCNPSKPINRFIIEYKKEVQASMNWDAEFNAIFFDKLISQVNDPNRKYTYVPSGQYDGFKWSNGKWNYVENLIPIENRENGDAPAPTPLSKGKSE